MDAMREKPRHLTEKLKALWKDKTQQEVADLIGVSHGQVKQYYAGAVPGALVLLRIADVWKKPVRWLVDDEQPIEPVPKGRVDFNIAKDVDVMADFRRRYRERAQVIADQIAEAERIDWAHVKQALESATNAQELPAEATAAVRIVSTLRLAVLSRLSMFVTVLNDGNEGVDVPVAPADSIRFDSLELRHLTARITKLWNVIDSTKLGRELLEQGMFGTLSQMIGASDEPDAPRVSVSRVNPEESVRQAMGAYREAGGTFTTSSE